MNKIELMQCTQRTLRKFFGDLAGIKVSYNQKDGNKVNFVIDIERGKFRGFIFHNNTITHRDVRNILFSFKRRVIASLSKEV